MAALWEIVMHSQDTSLDASNEFINLFGYRSNLAVINEAAELLNAFEAHIIPPLADVLSQTTFITRLEARNVTDGIGYLDRVLSPTVPGVQTGDPLPRFVAWGFKYQRATIGARSGSKRFGRLCENQVTDGLATGGSITLLNTLASALSDALPLLTIDTWFPEILERKPAGVFPWTSHPIAGVVYSSVTTQNSRKR